MMLTTWISLGGLGRLWRSARPGAAVLRACCDAPPRHRATNVYTASDSEKDVRLAQKVQVGPCIPVGIQLEEAKFGIFLTTASVAAPGGFRVLQGISGSAVNGPHHCPGRS